MKNPKIFLVILFVLSPFLSWSQNPARDKKLKRGDCFFGIHFDLHASESIQDAGRTLTYEMVDTFLTRVGPDFIQIDCKGHPGISSYPTTAGYHVKGFEKDPLKLFREVTEKNNVGLYMHFSGVWDSKVVKEHPGWAIVKPDGEKSTQKVSFFSPYLDTFMIPQLKELAGKYRVDGAWIDGECWAVEPDYGEASVREFTRRTGITDIPYKATDRYFPEFMEYTRSLFRTHLKKYIDEIHSYSPGFQITSNWAYSSMMPEKVTIGVDFLSGDVTPQNGVYRSAFEARCLAPQGKPWDLMAWGFSWNGGEMPMSIKSALQLKQEAAEIISMGGGVQFYFQQNEDLSIKPWLAPMLADIGQFCRERQKFVHKSVQVPQIALLYPSEAYQRSSPVPYSRGLSMLQGALYSLLDGQQSVEIIMEHNMSGKMRSYPLIVIPECEYLPPSILNELKSYVSEGGTLLIIGPDAFMMFREELGILSAVKQQQDGLFIEAAGRIGAVRSPYAEITFGNDTKVLSYLYTGSDFRKKSDMPSAVMRKYGKGSVAAVLFNSGTAYSEYKTFVIRDFISSVTGELFSDRIVITSGSSLLHVTVNTLNGRLCVNLINSSGESNGAGTIGFDEIRPLTGLTVSVRCEKKPESVLLQPENKILPFRWENGRAVMEIDRIDIHSVIEIVN